MVPLGRRGGGGREEVVGPQGTEGGNESVVPGRSVLYH